MKRARGLAVLLAVFVPACAFLAPTESPPPAAPTTAPAPSTEPSPAASVAPSTEPTVEPDAATPAARPTPSPAPTAVPPTTAPLALEVLQIQTWADSQGNIRTNVLVRNPYDFPVVSAPGSTARVLNAAGEVLNQGPILFLDGVSAGSGYILPGETIAANICYTCEEVLPAEPWESVETIFIIEDATGRFNVVTEVEASNASVAFGGDPIFDVSGTVKNNSEAAVQRISMRFFVFDETGSLVGAAEASAWNVEPGATANVSGYGLGQTPGGAYAVEVSALGVNYAP